VEYASWWLAVFRRVLRIASGLAVLAALASAEPGEGQEKARKARPRRPEQSEPQAAPQMVTPDFRYTQNRRGKPLFSIFARKGEVYANNDLVLTGVEEILLYAADGRTSRLSADFGRWYNEQGDFEVWGEVRGQVQTDQAALGGELRFETERLVYKDSWKAVVTMKPVRLATESVVTTGLGLNYNLVTQELVLPQSVVTRIALQDPRNPGEVEISAGHLVLQPEQRTAVYTENPVLKLDQNELSGQRMAFYFASGEERLDLSGQVVGRFHAEQRPDGSIAPGSGPPILVSSESAHFHRPSRSASFLGSVSVDREGEKVRCGKMVVLLNQEGHDVESVVAEENVEVIRSAGRARGGQLIYRYATDEGLLSRKPIVLLPEGELSAQLIHFRKDGSLLGERQVRLRHRPAKPRQPAGGSALDLEHGPVDILADRLNYAPQTGFVVFQDRVRVERPGSQLTARKLTLHTSGGSSYQTLVAEQDVKLVTESRLLTGHSLRYDMSSRQATIEGRPAQARTPDDVVQAQVLTFSGSDEESSARGSVVIELQRPDSDARPGRRDSARGLTRAFCGRAHFSRGGARVELAEEVRIEKSDDAMKLRAEQVEILLGADRKVNEILARGSVQLEQTQGNARGDQARFSEDQRQIEIEGSSVVIEQQGRQSFPQRAIFHLDTRKVEFIGVQDRVRTVLPVAPEPP
jgi:LPS export ABC transporter protein LptC